MPQCTIILDGFFLITGFKKSCISGESAPLKEWTFTLLVLDNVHPFMSLIIESPAIRISGFDFLALRSRSSKKQKKVNVEEPQFM